ncbi:hypothetical protein CHIBA101_2289 [Actinomyces sp. Chiba101]|uniref:WXG100 family type VII secretion target n=1 Tax=Actinomyces TaxID=1654 RepID=UPI000974E89A|nr:MULTISPECIES: WXG100 family type VII secretion target [Actinomyces]BAW94110.1 hypothetical protein CHIBA101_2289 [Actinomyces sp. Chiba101]GAV95330.1 hypothetical protein ADENT20671_2114 [Actinomyces denticolens]SUU13813.1 WXG100 family type VII secretion target [Actinomyces denticolens]
MSDVSANLESMESLYRTISDDVTSGASIITSVTNALNSTVWESTNATDFRAQWEEFKPKLKTFVESLVTAGNAVANNHNGLNDVNGEGRDPLSQIPYPEGI